MSLEQLQMLERQIGVRLDDLHDVIDKRFDTIERRQDKHEEMLLEIRKQVNRWAGALMVIGAGLGWLASWIKGVTLGH